MMRRVRELRYSNEDDVRGTAATSAATGGRGDAPPSQAPVGSDRRSLRAAAMRMAEERLREEDLSPTVIAQELNVSVRTLHRSFTGTGESIMGYVRRRRLEQAREALLSGHGEVSVSEVAQRWHFADSSHFIRAFRVHFGLTPARVLHLHG